jgi:hypothetical protein
MSYDLGTATIYAGLPAEISENASSGILWLKSLWTVLDSLDPATAVPLSTVATLDCRFIINGAPPRSPGDIEAMFVQRANLLGEFGHTRYPVRIVDIDLGEGKRLVNVQGTSLSVKFKLFESSRDIFLLTNTNFSSVIKADPEKTELKVAEMTVAELLTVDGKLLATTIGSYLDPSPVAQKMQEIMTKQ